MAANAIVWFGPYRLEFGQGLRVGQREVQLTPKCLSLLQFLAAQPSLVCSKEEIFKNVWPMTSVTDASLATCVRQLRAAIGDTATKPRYIQTVHRRGYRFIATLEQTADVA